MYSRYSGVSIPQNYGGSRFSHLAEVETKTHRPTTTVTPIKASPVPIIEDEDEKIEADYQFEEDIDESSEQAIDEDEQDVFLQEDKGEKARDDFSLASFISHLEKDDILLLGLILLLISDSSKDNYDIIMVLALLLVGGK
jgi:hypothetical protein